MYRLYLTYIVSTDGCLKFYIGFVYGTVSPEWVSVYKAISLSCVVMVDKIRDGSNNFMRLFKGIYNLFNKIKNDRNVYRYCNYSIQA